MRREFLNLKWAGLALVSLAVMAVISVGSVNASEPVLTHVGVVQNFDHEMHLTKVLKPRGLSCDHCHNVQIGEGGSVARSSEMWIKSTFIKPPREICHECHRSEEVINKKAPQACFTCHVGNDELQSIKPKSHSNVSWKTSHSLDARTDGNSCMNCHATSQCTKCHLSRNDIEMQNHSRNFKFFHSVEARARPQSCDACHTKSFCTNCHLGVKK